jgi:hypothetical protein
MVFSAVLVKTVEIPIDRFRQYRVVKNNKKYAWSSIIKLCYPQLLKRVFMSFKTLIRI